VVVIEVPSISPPNKTEETLDSLLKTDETCVNTVKNLSDLHDETMSIINLHLALDALESGNLQFGIESLQASAKNRTNAAASYNLGICYERGIGVEQDRAKVNSYF
jgi:TPR repeat protein